VLGGVIECTVADLGAILIGLIPVAFGFALGYGVKKVDDWRSNHRTRKGLAAALATEVEAIRGIAEDSIKINGPSVAEVRERLSKGGSPLGGVGIADVDYQTTVYHSNLVQLQILGENLMVQLTELYRWVEYAHHQKRLNLEAESAFLELSKSVVARGGMTDVEKDMLSYNAGATVVYGTQYLKNQKRVLELASHALRDLERLGNVQVRGKVSVSTGEPLRETFPKR